MKVVKFKMLHYLYLLFNKVDYIYLKKNPMEFVTFSKYFPKIAKETLPATSAHAKMIPPGRLELLNNQDYNDFNPRKAAILMLLYPKNGETHLALIVRNSYPGIHSSQIAFPGGKVEESDTSLAHTAIRETFEEIGVPESSISIISALTEVYIPPSNFLVYPFLGFTNQEVTFVLCEDEVADIIELPLVQFLDDSNLVHVTMSTSYDNDIPVPAFQIKEHLVWGATAMMMMELKEIIKKVI